MDIQEAIMPVYDELYKFKINCIMYSYVMSKAQHMQGTQNSRKEWGGHCNFGTGSNKFGLGFEDAKSIRLYGFALQVKLGSICGI
jgi:hypothetical protein